MNGRTCQLCGKPLSRMWGGGGGDFCSREHRNQYRLRCGMDTLLEANKHASLMRRRDQPKQFPAAHLQINSAITPRLFGPIRPIAQRPAIRPVPAPAPSANPYIRTDGVTLLPPPVSGGPATSLPRPAQKLPARPARPVPPVHMRSRSIPVALGRAGAVNLGPRLTPPPGPRRSFVMLAHPSRRPVVPPGAFRSLALKSPGSIAGRVAQTVKLAGKVGNAFRVSGNIGFRLPALRFTTLAIPGKATTGFAWPNIMTLRRSAHIGAGIPPFPAEQDFRPAPARTPAFKAAVDAPGLNVSRSVALTAPLTRGGPLAPRLAEWRRPEPESALVMRQSGLQIMQSSAASKCITLKVFPARAAAAHRSERAPFEPQDRAMISISYPWNSSR